MATDRRSLVIDAVVNPAIMSGLSMIADTVTLSDTKVLTITFPAKTINAVIAQSFADTDATKVVATSSVSNDVGTVTLTKSGTGKISYIIIFTPTETIEANTISANETENPIG